jgi:hypothetical protein
MSVHWLIRQDQQNADIILQNRSGLVCGDSVSTTSLPVHVNS